MQGFVNHFAITNCVLKDISVKGFENVLQIFLRLKRLLTSIAYFQRGFKLHRAVHAVALLCAVHGAFRRQNLCA